MNITCYESISYQSCPVFKYNASHFTAILYNFNSKSNIACSAFILVFLNIVWVTVIDLGHPVLLKRVFL